MSYDLRIGVRIHGTDFYETIASRYLPEHGL